MTLVMADFVFLCKCELLEHGASSVLWDPPCKTNTSYYRFSLGRPQQPSDSCWRHTCSLPVSTFIALGVSRVMRYINLHHLLTYLSCVSNMTCALLLMECWWNTHLPPSKDRVHRCDIGHTCFPLPALWPVSNYTNVCEQLAQCHYMTVNVCGWVYTLDDFLRKLRCDDWCIKHQSNWQQCLLLEPSVLTCAVQYDTLLLCGKPKQCVVLLKAQFPLPELTARVDGWPVSITRQHGPCWWVRVSTSRVDGQCWRPVNSASGNARPSTRPVLTCNGNRSPVNSGSGNRALSMA